jgi:hypothetical protein
LKKGGEPFVERWAETTVFSQRSTSGSQLKIYPAVFAIKV